MRTDDALLVSAALHALDGWAAEVHLVPDDTDLESIGDEVSQITDNVLQTVPDAVPRPGVDSPPEVITTCWVVYTSGTTGAPKPIRHTLRSLTRTVSNSGAADRVWGLVYDPNRMAGLQVLLQAAASRAPLVAPRFTLPLTDRIRALINAGVTALSATPTIWRQILQIPEAAAWPLRQITLGGEIADRYILHALSAAYPEARIVHVFASTETGAAFSVRDGREGFPVSYLAEPPRGVALDVRDGILHVESPEVSAAGPDGFASTGDRVEIRGDRVIFLGRETGVVNVGGSNVWPEEVESLLRSHPDVAEARVTSTPNALAGNLLVASVVIRPGADPTRAGRRLRSWVREHAPTSHVPATVKVVDALGVSKVGKLQR